MNRFRALLLGAGEYDDPKIRPLPCVRTDLADIAKRLEKRGYELDESSDLTGRATRPQLMEAVGSFLDSARDGDTLLVYLSGHGVHTDGMTHLIPSDAPLGRRRLAFFCVPLDTWREDIEQSAADGIVFMVDACREGYDETAMAVSHTGWDAERIARAGRSQVAWIFPCGEGEVARFVRAEEAGGQSFSLFARAVASALQDRATPATLDGFADVVAEQIAELTAKYGKPKQEVHTQVSGGRKPFAILPAPTGGPHEWEMDVANHEAWSHVSATDALTEPLRADTLGLTRHLTRVRLRSRLPGGIPKDPWADQWFAARVSAQVAFLLRTPLRALELSPAEAALLAAVPYLHDAHWGAIRAKYASLLAPSSNGAEDRIRASFDRYVHGYPRLRRRAAAGEGDTRGQLGWWFLHRWAASQPEAYAPGEISGLLPAEDLRSPCGEVFAAAHVRAILRVIRADTGFFADPENVGQPADDLVIAGGKPSEQVLRLRLIAYVAAVAHRMAIEAAFLGDVVADHIGIAHPIDLTELHATLDGASWVPLGGYGRDLSAQCVHPGVETALREHTADFDGMLRHLHVQAARRSSLASLLTLPVRASADGVGPLTHDGKAVYDDSGVRFRLAEDRVQELLMGEQLYGKRTAAIRELYQNALDACRYREARTEYLRRAKRLVTDWTGSIRFTQGTDEDGRAYLDCIDNGIGMGRRELRDLFARAGVRYVELPEFLEEKYEWDRCRPPVRLIPNSRFGVGVLSYFMLADEITVDTCRLSREGQPGERLQVTIAGPGSLFHIQSLGPGEEAGTTIRLYLNPGTEPVSCLKVLGEVLWVAEFATEASEGNKTYTWAPGALGFEQANGYSRFRSAVAGGPDPSVWWLASDGKLLVDGVSADSNETIKGAVINLTGEQVRLSVDRSTIISLSAEYLDGLMSAAIPGLISGDPAFLSPSWLWQLAKDRPTVADHVASAVLSSHGDRIRARGLSFWKNIDLQSVGCFPADSYLTASSGRWQDYEDAGVEGCVPSEVGYDCPDNIAAWRLGALAANGGQLPLSLAELPRPEGPALPSDDALLRIEQKKHGAVWLDVRKPVNAGHILKTASELSRSVAEVTARLAHLGYDVPDVELIERHAALASLRGDGTAPWRTTQDRIQRTELELAATRHGLEVNEFAKQLRALGYDAPSAIALRLASEDLDGLYPWRPTGSIVPAIRVTQAAHELGLDVVEAARHLTDLGYDARLDPVGVAVANLEFDEQPLWSWSKSFLPRAWAIRAARRLRVPLKEVTEQLRLAGYQTVHGWPPSYLAQYIDDDQWLYIDDDQWLHGGEDAFPDTSAKDYDNLFEPGAGICRAQILKIALAAKRAPRQVAEDLAALGYRLPLIPRDAEAFPDLLVVVSQRLDGFDPWLKDKAPVPAGHVIAAVQRDAVRGLRDIVELLNGLGYRVPDLSAVTEDDKKLLSYELDGRSPWLPSYEPVGLWHLARSAVKLGVDPAKAGARLRELGYEVPQI